MGRPQSSLGWFHADLQPRYLRREFEWLIVLGDGVDHLRFDHHQE